MSVWESIALTHEWEAVRISGRCLNQELVPPAIKRIETLRIVDIVDQHAAVGTSVESNS